MSNQKRWLTAALMLVTLVIAVPLFIVSASNRTVRVTVDGQLVHFVDQPPIIVNNRVLVPVRGVFEHMGFTVT